MEHMRRSGRFCWLFCPEIPIFHIKALNWYFISGRDTIYMEVMSYDIGHILNQWPYDPGQVTARRIRGRDGKEKIQLRLDLGLLQMETTGRPDGQKPHGYDSLLDYYNAKLRQYVAEHGTDDGFEIDEQACEALRTEGTMYYHRYLAEFILEDYTSVVRDTKRNLNLFDLCNAYAAEESDRDILEQYRPYVIMMMARAAGQKALNDKKPQAAQFAVQDGIERIRQFYQHMGREKLFERSGEVAVLRMMLKEIKLKLPPDPLKRLKRALNKAVEDERYEEAANLRDKIKRYSQQHSGGG